MKIGDTFQTIKSRQILTSRGDPTTEIELHTSTGTYRTSCPSGASKGSKEAKCIIDKNQDTYLGKSVTKALFNIKTLILPRIKDIFDIEISDQNSIDSFLINLDGTLNKSRLGANSVLPISTAFCRAGAASKERSLREHINCLLKKLIKSDAKIKCNKDEKFKFPIPYFNVLNGGCHAGSPLVFQEIMISFHTNEYDLNLMNASIFYFKLKEFLKKEYGDNFTGVGDEGGFFAPESDLRKVLDLVKKVCEENGFENMKIGIDCAANEFYKNGKYNLTLKNCNLEFKHDLNKTGEEDLIYTSKELHDFYKDILLQNDLINILEDPFAEDDHDGWKMLVETVEKINKESNRNIKIIGDDLTVTNAKYVELAVDKKLCTGLLVKPNQIGTVSETLEAVKKAKEAGWVVMASHRSGETEDTFIADFAVGISADYIKAGAPCRGERIAKYNQLLRIYESMKKKKQLVDL